MEIAQFPSAWKENEVWHQADFKPLNFKPPSFLSTEDADDILKAKTFKRIEFAWNPDRKFYRIMMVAAVVLSIFVGTAVFLGVSRTEAIIEHASDSLMPYACDPTWPQCRDLIVKNLTNAEGFFIDHRKDVWVPALVDGLAKAFLAVITTAFTPHILYHATVFSMHLLERLANYKTDGQKTEISHFQRILTHTSPIDQAAPLDPALFSKLLALQVLPRKKFKSLSFLQIRQIHKQDVGLFEDLLAEKKFSNAQCAYWNALKRMLQASEDKLVTSIQNLQQLGIEGEEFYCLEALAQELPGLTPRILEALVNRFDELTHPFWRLEKDALKTAIKVTSIQKCSLETSLRSLMYTSFAEDDVALLQFKQKKQGRTFEMPKRWLCFSSIFRNMFADVPDHSTEAIFIDAELKAFKIILHYLQSGQWQWPVTDIKGLMQAVEQYDFTALKRPLELQLVVCQAGLLQTHTFEELLQLCEDCHLDVFRKSLEQAFTSSIEKDLPFDVTTFMRHLRLATDYRLSTSIDDLRALFNERIAALSAEDCFTTMLVPMFHSDLDLAIFSILTPVFQKKPLLLKFLFEEAARKQRTQLLEAIIAFCEQDKNFSYLACWPTIPELYPSEPLMVVIQS